MPTADELELNAAVDRVLESSSLKKLIVAGPGAGKTTLFEKLLERAGGVREQRLVLTFINNLKRDLDRSLGQHATVQTLHGYCQSLLHRYDALRDGLTADFVCYPSLVSLIKKDWEWLKGSPAPRFVEVMRALACAADAEAFYLNRAAYYDAVDFDDSVYRIARRLGENAALVPEYELVLIDEFQDFNKMEAAVIDLLGQRNPIVVAGDDDQALYSQLRGASWEYIRARYNDDGYEVFNLPFCMRCPEVVVAAVNDVIGRARAAQKLGGRIDKPFRFFEPVKGEDSRRFPHIDLARTSVQRLGGANYFGRYVEQAIRAIPDADFEQAAAKHEPAALVIGSRPYLPQIEAHLIEVGLLAPEPNDVASERDQGLAILHGNPDSNLGWRIVLGCGDQQTARELVRQAAEQGLPLAGIIPEEMKVRILGEAAQMVAQRAGEENENLAEDPETPRIKLTSFEGAKGLSAQHVVLVGLHDGDLPRNPDQIGDIEICKFLVGLTRTKKKCTILTARRFGQQAKRLSTLVGWLRPDRLHVVEVNADYWR